jgi:hypothetical protein
LRLSRTIGNAFALLDLLLVFLIARLDGPATRALVPYLMYRVYAVWWGNAVAKLNPSG